MVLRGEEGNVGVVIAHVGRRGEGGTVHSSESSLREAALEFTAPAKPIPPVVREQGEANWRGWGAA